MRDRIDAAPSMAVFCDFENVALGVRDANYDTFDIGLVLERLLDKGNIVVKKAYADWDRYKAHKKPLHEAAFELVGRFAGGVVGRCAMRVIDRTRRAAP
jgi:hypothetical protein